MTNNYNKVSPSNRVDFSRIRRHASGGGIQKYEAPANGIKRVSGITHALGTSWRTSVFEQIKADILKKLQDPNVSQEDKRAYVNELNELQGSYATIRSNHPDLNPTQFDQAVQDYQKQIIAKYNYVNNKGIAYGLDSAHSRYVFGQTNQASRQTGDVAGDDDWASSADGYFSGQTQDRTLLGFKDDWDENSDPFKAWQTELGGYNLETYMGNDGAYRLRLLDPEKEIGTGTPVKPAGPAKPTGPTGPTQPEQPVGPQGPGGSGVVGGGGDLTPDQYIKPFKPEAFTAWIPDSLILANSLIGNRLKYNNAMKEKMPLVEAPHHDYTLTNDYASQQHAANQAQDLRSRANQAASSTSNLEANLGAQLSGNYQAGQAELQGQLQKQAAYNQSIGEATNVANWNTDNSVAIANQNRKSNVADYNQKLNANSEYHLGRLGAQSDFINKIWTDWGEHKKNEQNEQASYEQDIRDWNYYKAKEKAYQDYAAAVRDPYKSIAWGNVNKNIQSYMASLEGQELNDADKKFADFYTTLGDMSESERNDAIKDFFNNNTDFTLAKRFDSDWKEEQRQAKLKYDQALTGAMNDYKLGNIGTRNTYTTQGYWPFRAKEGGILKAKDGDRMVKYMESHRKKIADAEKNRIALLESNRKSYENAKKTSMDVSKQLQESLKRELESLDRETLMLLRSVFK